MKQSDRERMETELANLYLELRPRKPGAGGIWTRGLLDDYFFEALVFPEHAEVCELRVGAEPYLETLDAAD
jgi:hypothetical protein